MGCQEKSGCGRPTQGVAPQGDRTQSFSMRFGHPNLRKLSVGDRGQSRRFKVETTIFGAKSDSLSFQRTGPRVEAAAIIGIPLPPRDFKAANWPMPEAIPTILAAESSSMASPPRKILAATRRRSIGNVQSRRDGRSAALRRTFVRCACLSAGHAPRSTRQMPSHDCSI